MGGLLAGVTVPGVLMGMFQSNAGGAWDNAKKSFEKGVVIDGETYYKKSEPHKASVTGDTVGDPFKDTSGPSMNILIKLMSIVSLVIAPHIAGIEGISAMSNGHGKAGTAMETCICPEDHDCAKGCTKECEDKCESACGDNEGAAHDEAGCGHDEKGSGHGASDEGHHSDSLKGKNKSDAEKEISAPESPVAKP